MPRLRAAGFAVCAACDILATAPLVEKNKQPVPHNKHNKYTISPGTDHPGLRNCPGALSAVPGVATKNAEPERSPGAILFLAHDQLLYNALLSLVMHTRLRTHAGTLTHMSAQANFT